MTNQTNNIEPRIAEVLKLIFPRKKPEKVLEKLEKAMEKDLAVNIFPLLDIRATTKSDRKSLPYQHEILVSLVRSSYLNSMLEFHHCYRTILKELLNKNVRKIRFYVQVDTSCSENGPFILGQIDYKFRYYIHE